MTKMMQMKLNQASSFKIYAFKSYGFNITHLLSSISQSKFHVLRLCYWEFLV